MSGVRRLAPPLEACTAPHDEVAITGILSQILVAQLPPDLVTEEFEVAITQVFFRSVSALTHMQEHHLIQLGLGVRTVNKTAAMVCGIIAAPQAIPLRCRRLTLLSRALLMPCAPHAAAQ